LLLPVVVRADAADPVQTMLGVAALPVAQDRVVYPGALPKSMLLIPQPTGLALVGSVAGSKDGKETSEVRYYAAAPGSIPDLNGYAAQLATQGWSLLATMPISPFASGLIAALPRTFCKAGAPMVIARSVDAYLVIQANAAPCASPRAIAMRPPAQAPFPRFTPPGGATFVGTTQQTFGGATQLATIGVVSSESANALVAAYSKQMTDAGWAAKTVNAASGDSAAFTIQVSRVDWVAALSVVQIGSGMYMCSVSALKTSEKPIAHVRFRFTYVDAAGDVVGGDTFDYTHHVDADGIIRPPVPVFGGSDLSRFTNCERLRFPSQGIAMDVVSVDRVDYEDGTSWSIATPVPLP
jgi:hypothetical protein